MMKKILTGTAILIYILSTAVCCFLTVKLGDGNNPAPSGEQTRESRQISATDLGVMCISAAYPSMGIELTDSRDNDNPPAEEAEKEDEEAEKEEEEPAVTGDDPQVLIVHTHATESYLPSSGGNFHSKSEENTVRDVGNTLSATLEKQGIAVVHDKTLHDDPSYNNSYNRSYQTVEKLLDQYPTIRCVIDLHRDAIASDTPAATVSTGGKSCARYSYVIGTGASTYQDNRAFVDSLNRTAKENYSGFTGKVLERGYIYNQNLSSKYLLLEIGYNTNDIQDCRNTAEIFGNILADALKKS